MGTKVHSMGAASAPAAATPSAEIIRAASTVNRASAKDATGRLIEVERISLLQMFRLTDILGAGSTNEARMNLTLAAVSVVAIDGEKVSFPSRMSELEILLQRLDFTGLAAATEAVAKLPTDGVKLDTAKN